VEPYESLGADDGCEAIASGRSVETSAGLGKTKFGMGALGET